MNAWEIKGKCVTFSETVMTDVLRLKKKERENVKNREGGAGGVNQWSCPNVEVLVFLNVHLQGWLMYTIPL